MVLDIILNNDYVKIKYLPYWLLNKFGFKNLRVVSFMSNVSQAQRLVSFLEWDWTIDQKISKI